MLDDALQRTDAACGGANRNDVKISHLSHPELPRQRIGTYHGSCENAMLV
jgi:hypothetical protein